MRYFPLRTQLIQTKRKKAISEWKHVNAGVKKLGTQAKQSAHLGFDRLNPYKESGLKLYLHINSRRQIQLH